MAVSAPVTLLQFVLAEHEPYKRIVYTVRIDKTPAEVINQLTEDGILIAPAGDIPSQSLIVVENA